MLLNPNQAGGGQICPTDFQTLITQEPKVGLTSNQAVNSILYDQMEPSRGPGGTCGENSEPFLEHELRFVYSSSR